MTHLVSELRSAHGSAYLVSLRLSATVREYVGRKTGICFSMQTGMSVLWSKVSKVARKVMLSLSLALSEVSFHERYVFFFSRLRESTFSPVLSCGCRVCIAQTRYFKQSLGCVKTTPPPEAALTRNLATYTLTQISVLCVVALCPLVTDKHFGQGCVTTSPDFCGAEEGLD